MNTFDGLEPLAPPSIARNSLWMTSYYRPTLAGHHAAESLLPHHETIRCPVTTRSWIA